MSHPSDQAAGLERLWRATPESRDLLAAAIRHNLRLGQNSKAAALLQESWRCPALGQSPLPDSFNNRCQHCSEPVLRWNPERKSLPRRLRTREPEAVIEACLQRLSEQGSDEIPRCLRISRRLAGHEVEVWSELGPNGSWLVLSFSPLLPPLREASAEEISPLTDALSRSAGAVIDVARLESADHLLEVFQAWEALLGKRGGRLLWILPATTLHALRRLLGQTQGWFTSFDEARQYLNNSASKRNHEAIQDRA